MSNSEPDEQNGSAAKPWTFLTTHTQVLLCLASNPDVRLREVATTVGITERAVQRILADLVEAGYVTRTRQGRRNRYSINSSIEMRHRLQEGHQVGPLLELLGLEPPVARWR